MSNSSLVLSILFICLILLFFFAGILSMASVYEYNDSYVDRYKAETERLQLQQKLCTPENLITEEGN